MSAPQIIRARSREAFFLGDAKRAVEFMCGPYAAIAGDAEIDGVGEAGELEVVGSRGEGRGGGVLGLKGWVERGVAASLEGEGLETFFEEVAAFAVEDVGLNEAGPEVGYSYCAW